MEIFAKQYWHLFDPLFSLYFAHFQNLNVKVPLKYEKYIKLLWILRDTNSKCPIIIRKNTSLPASSSYSGPSIELKLLVRSIPPPWDSDSIAVKTLCSLYTNPTLTFELWLRLLSTIEEFILSSFYFLHKALGQTVIEILKILQK